MFSLQIKQKLQMEIDCKATEIEQLQSKLNETASLSSADNDPEDTQVLVSWIFFVYLEIECDWVLLLIICIFRMLGLGVRGLVECAK